MYFLGIWAILLPVVLRLQLVPSSPQYRAGDAAAVAKRERERDAGATTICERDASDAACCATIVKPSLSPPTTIQRMGERGGSKNRREREGGREGETQKSTMSTIITLK